MTSEKVERWIIISKTRCRDEEMNKFMASIAAGIHDEWYIGRPSSSLLTTTPAWITSCWRFLGIGDNSGKCFVKTSLVGVYWVESSIFQYSTVAIEKS